MADKPLLHLIFPRFGGTGVHLTFGHRMPPMALLVLAAHARRAGWRVKVIDQNHERLPTERPDLACLTVWTSTAAQAYQVADDYRAQGVPVVLGGVHASLLPGEALRHADSVFCGEADTLFATVLDDALAGRLQPLYQGEWKGMEDVPRVEEWADILQSWPITRYAPLNTIQTTRGCRFNCDFCSVIRINGRGSRHRDPDEVVDEIQILKRVGQHLGDFAYIFFLDDDLAADLDFAGELFETIIRRKCNFTWGAQASIGLARNTEVLDLATRSGCRVLFTGFESMSRDSLIEANKKNRPGEFGELVAKLHKRGIAVEGGLIFGFDTDSPDVFDLTVDFADKIEIDLAHFSILTPYPGTQTFAKLYADGRITSFDWRRYNLYQVVFEPERMSPQQLQEGLASAYRNFYGGTRRWKRFRRDLFHRDPKFHGAMTASNWNYNRNYRNPGPGAGDPYVASPDDLSGLLLASAAPAQEALEVAFANVQLGRKAAAAAPAGAVAAPAAPGSTH